MRPRGGCRAVPCLLSEVAPRGNWSDQPDPFAWAPPPDTHRARCCCYRRCCYPTCAVETCESHTLRSASPARVCCKEQSQEMPAVGDPATARPTRLGAAQAGPQACLGPGASLVSLLPLVAAAWAEGSVVRIGSLLAHVPAAGGCPGHHTRGTPVTLAAGWLL